MARTIAKDYDAKRLHILKTAANVFATEGFDRASMALIAQTCGISKANIYHYYVGKDALLFDILDTYLSALRDTICNQETQGQTPETRLRVTIQAILRAYDGADDEHRIQIAGFGMLPPDQQSKLRGYQKDLVKYLSDILSDIEPSLISDRTRLRNTTMAVFGMLNWHYMWNPMATTEERMTYADLVATMVLDGVRPRQGR